MKTIEELNPGSNELQNLEYNYQTELTRKLDDLSAAFDQEIINEIVLWKVNRYAKLNPKSLELINKINTTSHEIDLPLTGEILMELLSNKGVRLPMASTILRFKNPNIYQIIDQRVYRLLYGEKLSLKKNLNDNIIQYMDYLSKLRETCDRFEIQFSKSDRILYEFDKIHNQENIDY